MALRLIKVCRLQNSDFIVKIVLIKIILYLMTCFAFIRYLIFQMESSTDFCSSYLISNSTDKETLYTFCGNVHIHAVCFYSMGGDLIAKYEETVRLHFCNFCGLKKCPFLSFFFHSENGKEIMIINVVFCGCVH